MKLIKTIFLACSLCVSIVAMGQNIDVQRYIFDLELKENSDAITGKATIIVKFLKPTTEVVFDLASIVEDKGMQAFSVMHDNRMLQFNHRNNKLTIYLTQPSQAGNAASFEVNYMGVPRDGLIISQNQYGERTFFADNWPDRAHQWIPCVDRPDDKAAVEFYITAPAGYKVISNGEQVTDPKSLTSKWHYREELPLPTKVMVIGAARFAVSRVDSSFHVPVYSWVYKQDSAKGSYDYALAEDIIRFFESYVAPFPYRKLANVQSKTIFGGMENAGAIFYAENTVTGDRKSESLIAHEVAHQWFGNTATEKSFTHLWLSEGFATYLTDIYLENKYGVDSFKKRLMNERAEVLEFARVSKQAVVDSTSAYMDLLNPNSYQKGGWILHMLRGEVGDSVFQRIIQTYYQQYRHANADTRDFETVAEKVANVDLTWFFEQWLYRPGVPKLDFAVSKQKDKTLVTISQKQSMPYRLTLYLEYKSHDGSYQVQTKSISNSQEQIELPASITDLRVDASKLLYDGKIKL